jgi:hypothetical protein
MANYVLVVDLVDAGPKQYLALNQLMYEFGFALRGSETLRPAQFSVTSQLPLGGIKQMIEGRIRAELLPDVSVDAYEIKQLVQFSTAPVLHCRKFH